MMHHLGLRILTLLCCGGLPAVSDDVATWRKDENHLLLETEAAKLTDCPVRFPANAVQRHVPQFLLRPSRPVLLHPFRGAFDFPSAAAA
ncbi:MAG: hypothetical protein QF473_35950 [Planctomycetota bacterium]|jgi:hypothetical protein|nr:hypothetical protein [Planctomycetota bacterium]